VTRRGDRNRRKSSGESGASRKCLSEENVWRKIIESNISNRKQAYLSSAAAYGKSEAKSMKIGEHGKSKAAGKIIERRKTRRNRS